MTLFAVFIVDSSFLIVFTFIHLVLNNFFFMEMDSL